MKTIIRLSNLICADYPIPMILFVPQLEVLQVCLKQNIQLIQKFNFYYLGKKFSQEEHLVGPYFSGPYRCKFWPSWCY